MARKFIAASNQYLEAPTVIFNAPATMAAWITSDDVTAYRSAMSIGGSGATQWFEVRLRGDLGGSIDISINDGGSNASITGASFSAGVPFHLCAVSRSNSDREAYKNGVSFGTNGTALAPSALLNMCVGILHAAGGYFSPHNGAMAEVGFWRAALTPSEIKKLAAGAPCDAVRPAQLVAYLPLDGDIIDRRGNVWTNSGSGAVSTFVPRRKLWINHDTNVPAGGGAVTGDGASAGGGVALGVGAATAAATAAAVGTGVALGVGAFTMAPTDGVGNAAGAGTAAAIGALTAAAIATSAGLGTALSVGASIGIISAVGNAAGVGEALGYSPALLGGGEAGRGAKGGRARRKRITWLPADYDIETGEPRPVAAAPEAPPRVKLSKSERKVARLLAQYRGRDDDTAERARAQLEALYQAQNSELARFIARQQALDTQARAAAAIAAEDDEAVVAFMQWLLKQP